MCIRDRLSILKSCDGNPASVQRQTFDYPQPVAGEGQLITTYQKNGSPTPSFAGEPLRVTLDQNDADEFAGKLWEALNEDNKAVSYTHLDVYKRQTTVPAPRAALLHTSAAGCSNTGVW